jgi:hypothetical protein
MGVQARLGSKLPQPKDEESLPLTLTPEDSRSFKDHAPRTLAQYAKIAGGSIAIVYLFFCVFMTSSHNGSITGRGLDFPWPKPDPAPVPSFVNEGIKQCGLINRGPPSHNPATASRKKSDRFVKGTKGVWLKNGTVWTGEKGGEEVLYGVDVLLDGGVIRKVGKSEDVEEMVKGGKENVHEVELNGAWVTPGTSATAPLSSLTIVND